MPVLLVRHAHALARSDWDGDDGPRPLSVKGSRQAQLLVAVLAGFGPQSVWSSPAVRCVATVAPLAEEAGLDIRVETLLAEGSGAAAEKFLRGLAGTSAVLCSHGDVIPDVLAVLSERDGLGLGPLPRSQKASVWVLEQDGPKFTSARYLPPPRIG